MKRRATKSKDLGYTSVYNSLWHKDFVLLLLSEAIITASVIVFLFYVNKTLSCDLGCGCNDVVVAMGAFGVGLFVLGPFCAWLSERYRRNKVYIVSTLLLAATSLAMQYFNSSSMPKSLVCKEIIWCICLLCGSFYGLSKRLLVGVLVIDKCESYNRDEANYATMWTSYVLAGLAFMVSELSLSLLSDRFVGIVVSLAMVVAAVIVALIKFPFRTPMYEGRIFSFDRFLFFQGWQYSLILLIVAALTSLVVIVRHDWVFNAMLLPGFVVATLTHTAFKSNASTSREIVFGLLSMCLSLLTVAFSDVSEVFVMSSSLLLGMSLGYVAAGILTKFLTMSEHCKRGTIVSSHFLVSAIGMLMGACIALLS